MKRIFFSFLFLLTVLFPVSAQYVKIAGEIKDNKKGTTIEGATVRLLEQDSVLVCGVVSDVSGCFLLKKISKGSYILLISYVGYETNVIRLENTIRDVQIGEVLLQENPNLIKEVVVKADPVINKVNRQIIFPSLIQQTSSSTGLDLLNKVMLPDLIVNTTQNTISSLANDGSVQLQINNVKSTVQDILSLVPGYILRIEYINQPSVRYGEGVSCVINFVTRQLTSGMTGGVNLRNAMSTGYGNDNIYIKINSKASQFSLDYGMSYRHYKDQYQNTSQKYLLKDGTFRSLTKAGVYSPYKQQLHSVSLAYNWTKIDKSVFNVIFRNELSNVPLFNTIQLIKEVSQNNLRSHTGVKDKNYSPSFDLYYSLALPNKQNIYANIVGTYISSDYYRDYVEYPVNDNVIEPTHYYTVDGGKYSLIAEFIYEKEFDRGWVWSSGVRYNQSYLKNEYVDSYDKNITEMDNSDLYAYTELDGTLKKLGFNIGLGVSRQYFNENMHKYTYYTVRPRLSLSYSLTKNIFLQYSFSINPVLPSLARISDVSLWQNNYEIIVGNPSLKPYRGYMNNFSLRYKIGRYTIQANGHYQYSPKPIMGTSIYRVDENDHYYFVYGYANQKSFSQIQGKLNLRAEIIKDCFYLTAYGGINRYINKGNAYSHTYTGYFGGMQMEGIYKQWTLSASVRSRINYLFAETLNHGECGSDIALTYKHKSLKVGAGIMNAFLNKGTSSGQELLSSIAPKEMWNFTRDLGNMVYFSLAWNFSVGTMFKQENKIFYNSDIESGVVK